MWTAGKINLRRSYDGSDASVQVFYDHQFQPEPICDFIQNVLNRSTTLYNAEGGYSHENKKVILCALDRRQAVILQRFIRQTDDSAFIMITKSSETFGKGFRLTA